MSINQHHIPTSCQFICSGGICSAGNTCITIVPTVGLQWASYIRGVLLRALSIGQRLCINLSVVESAYQFFNHFVYEEARTEHHGFAVFYFRTCHFQVLLVNFRLNMTAAIAVPVPFMSQNQVWLPVAGDVDFP